MQEKRPTWKKVWNRKWQRQGFKYLWADNEVEPLHSSTKRSLKWNQIRNNKPRNNSLVHNHDKPNRSPKTVITHTTQCFQKHTFSPSHQHWISKVASLPFPESNAFYLFWKHECYLLALCTAKPLQIHWYWSLKPISQTITSFMWKIYTKSSSRRSHPGGSRGWLKSIRWKE